jgi:hypothetical protein
MSGGSSLKSMTRSNAPKGGAKEKKAAPTWPTTDAIGLKWSHPLVAKLPSTRPSPSYTVVGVHKLDGRYGRALMSKPTKKLVSEPTPSRKGSESSGALFRIKRMIKPQIRG